jgi:hypothetical protein
LQSFRKEIAVPAFNAANVVQSSEQGLVRLGKQITAFDEPDIIYMKLTGLITDEEVDALNRAHFGYCEGREWVYFLVDMSEVESVPGPVRKAAMEALKQMPARALAVYGAPLTARVFAKLITAGMRLFGKNLVVEFFDDEPKARTWIEQDRIDNAA